MTAQVDEHQHLSRILISDVLPDGLAYGEGPCGTECLCALSVQHCGMQSASGKSRYSFVREWFLLALEKSTLDSLIENAYAHIFLYMHICLPIYVEREREFVGGGVLKESMCTHRQCADRERKQKARQTQVNVVLHGI